MMERNVPTNPAWWWARRCGVTKPVQVTDMDGKLVVWNLADEGWEPLDEVSDCEWIREIPQP